MLNTITVMGRLVREPEKKTTQSGVSVTKMTVAVDRDYRNGDEKIADFIDVVCWRGTADFVSNYIGKGRMVVVNGSLQSRKWEDKEGGKHVSWEIQAQNVYFADSRKEEGSKAGSGIPPERIAEYEKMHEDGDLPF